MPESFEELLGRAKAVLDGNWLGRYTKPSPHLYPHQWNWDSGFIAIGYSHYDQARAQQELSSLFAAQWRNGMVPQIVFNPDALGGYFPEPDFWQGERSSHHPANALTSGITMPPVHAMAALKIVRKAQDRNSARDWLEDLYPRLLKSQEFFYRDRDPNREGLAYIRHPWESGVDNAPTWDPPLAAMIIDKRSLPPYQRQDLKKGIPSSQRPSDDDYDRYVFLVDLFRKLNYDEAAIYEECPFVIQDPLLNSVLCKANEDLMELGQILGRDTGQLREWYDQTARSLRDKLWHAEHGAFDVYDLRAGEPIGTLTAAGFMPLLCGAPTSEQARIIYEFLESKAFCSMDDERCYSIPNYNLEGEYLDTTNYWRGPVWVNTNWLLLQGLRRYGFHEKADSVARDIIRLVKRCGFYEYFDPYTGKCYGTHNFSWTAALLIDVILQETGSGS
ncbi:MAG: glycoside hydrolase [Deltaproteobacteria bacterium]|nr:glycoside hydrolase [Deltaproteobacteria bacterium]